MSAYSEAEGHGGVEVCSRNVPRGIDHRGDDETGDDAYPKVSDPSVGQLVDDVCTGRGEDQAERADDLGEAALGQRALQGDSLGVGGG